MNARSIVLRFTGLIGGLLVPWAALGNGFDTQIVGRLATIEVGEGPAPLVAEPTSTAVSASVAISDDHLVREQIGFADGDSWEQEHSGTVAEMVPYLGGSQPRCQDDRCRENKKRLFLPVDPRWEAQVDALMLWQGNITSRPLYLLDGTTRIALDANQAQTPLTAGPRFGLFLNLDPVYSIEGNYFNVQSFGGDSSTVPTAGAYAMSNLAGFGFTGIDWAQVSTSGTIQSAELNWRRRTCGPITWLAGFRWVEWNQEMELLDLYQGGADRLRSVTGNNLYGGQVGLDMALWNKRQGAVRVNGIGKAGIFYNKAQQTTTADVGTGPLGAAAVADQTSFFGEVGASASVRLTRWLSWRAGYSVFWLSGVATPAEQLSTTNLAAVSPTATINTEGSVLLHGVTTGLEARW